MEIATSRKISDGPAPRWNRTRTSPASTPDRDIIGGKYLGACREGAIKLRGRRHFVSSQSTVHSTTINPTFLRWAWDLCIWHQFSVHSEVLGVATQGFFMVHPGRITVQSIPKGSSDLFVFVVLCIRMALFCIRLYETLGDTSGHPGNPQC